MFPLNTGDIADYVARALAEDVGTGGDITSRATIPAAARFRGVMDTRDTIVVAGLALADAFFKTLDPHCVIKHHCSDGDTVSAGTDMLIMEGNGRAMLTAERSALNTLQLLSGIATLTRQYVEAIADTGAILLDTRKTIPGFRALSKYATRLGGAQNHRMRLDDGLLIKDNHVAVAGGIAAAVKAAISANTGLQIQVECDSLEQVKQALEAGAHRLLLDNMTNDQLRACVGEVAGRVPTEASGGVRLDTIRKIAETGVTYISVGRITQSAPAADIGLDFVAL
jgi:nicotinate-nucleotide pyrophosphorylase (carboxylating)